MRQGMTGVPSMEAFLAQLSPGAKVGVDPALVSMSLARKWTARLGPDVELVPVEGNLLDPLWDAAGSRPAPPAEPLRVLPAEFSGESTAAKIARIREWMTASSSSPSSSSPSSSSSSSSSSSTAAAATVAAASTPSTCGAPPSGGAADACVVTALDDVMWLFNIRGGDVHFNPVCLSYAVITADDVRETLQVYNSPFSVATYVSTLRNEIPDTFTLSLFFNRPSSSATHRSCTRPPPPRLLLRLRRQWHPWSAGSRGI